MGLKVEASRARQVFADALGLATGKAKLPKEWLERTHRIGEAKSKTLTPLLGTALLAKATERHIDAFALREGESHKSYSARNLAKEVFVPCCAAAGIDIRTNGPEPLNNQPFLRAERVSEELNVKSNGKQDLLYLCECLRAVDFLENRSALLGLAAFLRSRLEATAGRKRVRLGAGRLSLSELERALTAFEAGDAEGGKTGQALAASFLSLAFPDVRTKRINDPSRRWPGDVGAFREDRLVVSVEVKQRAFTPTEILLFAKQLAEREVDLGVIAAFRQGTSTLDVPGLRTGALTQHGVDLAVYTTPVEGVDPIMSIT